MTWSLISELGLDAASSPGAPQESPLRFPLCATKAPDGTYLIVEDLAAEKSIPFAFEYRTVRVDAGGSLVYDSLASGIDDAFGCLMDDGGMAILRCAKWELTIVSPRGAVVDRLGLETFSKRPPKFVSSTRNGTFLVAFDIRVGQLDLVEIDRAGRLQWFLPARADAIGLAASAQLTRANTILIADPSRHVAVELDRSGRVVWQFGTAEHPSTGERRLSNPSSIRELPDGRRLIADTRNHRVLLVGPGGEYDALEPSDGNLSDPRFADALPNGRFLICDTGNARVIEVDGKGRVVWSYGNPAPRRRRLSYPRSVEVIAPGRYLIADTAHNRVVEATRDGITERPALGTPGLFWPRCARMQPNGALLIADGRNQRVVEVSPRGTIDKALSRIDAEDMGSFRDPHDVRMLANGHLLVTDSLSDTVLEVDWHGKVHNSIGHDRNVGLDDPHSAQQLGDGRVVIADSGNHRILVVDRRGEVAQEIDGVRSGSFCLRLHRPRHVEVLADDVMVIADTGNNRVLCATVAGRLIWEFSRVPDSALPRLSQPRWVNPLAPDEIVICDHLHHRILHVRIAPS